MASAKIEPRAAAISAVWCVAWGLFSLLLILGSWSTLEDLQARAAATTSIASSPAVSGAPTTAANSSVSPSPSASLSPSLAPTPTAASTQSGTTSKPTPPPKSSTSPKQSQSSSPSKGGAQPVASAAGPAQEEIPVLLWHVRGSFDLGMLLLAFAFGCLGAVAHGLYIITAAVGGEHPSFRWPRLGWFGPEMPLGGIVGLLVFVALRAGLLAATSGTTPVNMFGVAAVAGVAGLSVSRAFKRLLSSPAAGVASVAASVAPTIATVVPAEVAIGDLPRSLTLTGTALDSATLYVNRVAVEPTSVSATTAELQVTQDLVRNGQLEIMAGNDVATADWLVHVTG